MQKLIFDSEEEIIKDNKRKLEEAIDKAEEEYEALDDIPSWNIKEMQVN